MALVIAFARICNGLFLCGGLLCLLIIIVAVHADMILLNNSHLLTTLLLYALSAGRNRCARYMPLLLLNLRAADFTVLTHLKSSNITL